MTIFGRFFKIGQIRSFANFAISLGLANNRSKVVLAISFMLKVLNMFSNREFCRKVGQKSKYLGKIWKFFKKFYFKCVLNIQIHFVYKYRRKNLFLKKLERFNFRVLLISWFTGSTRINLICLLLIMVPKQTKSLYTKKRYE